MGAKGTGGGVFKELDDTAQRRIHVCNGHIQCAVVNKFLRLGSLGWDGDIPFSCDALRFAALEGRVLLDDSPEGMPSTAFPVDGWHSPLTENNIEFFIVSLIKKGYYRLYFWALFLWFLGRCSTTRQCHRRSQIFTANRS